jgi:ATP-dependent helicase/nuclease subunit A
VTLVDGDARTQIATELDRTLFVEAGAGTGKTTALVTRIVTLVSTGERPCPMRDIAAITFTENAAAELRNRLRHALTRIFSDGAAGVEEQARCRAALDDLDDASLSTLHGFASRLLADHPMAAGLPVGFTVQDEVRAGLERDVWWDRVVDDAFDDEQLHEVWTTALPLGLGPSSLRRVADWLHARWDLLNSDTRPSPPLPCWDLQPVIGPLRRAVDRYAADGPDGDALTTYLRGPLSSLLADLDAEDDDLGRATVLCAEGIATSRGNAGSWDATGIPKSCPKDLLKAADEAWQPQLAAVRTACLEHLLGWLRRVVLDDAGRRRRDGTLHFHDLLVLAQRLLRDNEDVRTQLRSRWPVVLVDEFQDTDPLQVQIVHLLAASPRPDTWHEAAVEAGRLFFVGDPKQSIYRFRRADVSLYAAVRDTIAARPALTLNFRSRPVILDVVNSALRTLMDGKADQVPYTDLHAARSGPTRTDPGPDVLLLGGPQTGDMEGVRRIEAQHVAATCRRVVVEEWLVRNGAEEKTRPASYRDIAILVPTRTSLSALERELQAGDVPYRIESRSLVWDTDIVRELLAVLEAVADPGDAVAVVTALRSAAFGCTDPELLQWRRAQGSWDFRIGGPPQEDGSAVCRAMAELNAYHERRWWTPVNQLVDQLIRERRMVELTMGLRRPRDHWRRLRFLADQARTYLDSGGSSLGGFVSWAREQAERGADAVETVVNEPDDDAVRILTIHSSKGLEFPVVLLSGINADDRLDVNTLWADDQLEVRVKGFQTPAWDAAHAAERAIEQAESVRLLYVATTRAEDHLVISLHHKAAKHEAKNHAGRLFAQLDALHDVGATHEAEAIMWTRSSAVNHPTALDLPARQTFLTGRDALQQRVRRSLPVTASGLSGQDDESPRDELTTTVDSAEQADQPVHLRAPSAGGATLGSAVHRVLELVDFGADEQRVRRIAAAVTAELEAPHLHAETVRRVEVALRSDLLTMVGSDVWKEVPICAPVGERLIEGYIDLVVTTPDGLLVIDYKTDSVASDEDMAAKVAHYTPQLRAYAGALKSATGLHVAGAALLFIGPQNTAAKYVRI